MLHPQAQKLLIAMKGVSYTPNVKDVISAHKFSLHTHQNCIDGANTYINVASKCDGLYPFIGTTLASLAFNLTNIGTNNATNYYLNFVGSPTPTVGGGSVPWNGTTQYAITGITGATVSNRSNTLGYYSLTDISTVGKTNDMGNNRTFSTTGIYLSCKLATTNMAASLNSGTSALAATSDSLGFCLASRVGTTTTIKMFKNGILLANSSSTYSSTIVPNGFFIGAVDSNSITYSLRTCAGAVIARDFSEAEGISLSNAFLNLNTLK